jgi:hypothetical protein
MPLGGWWGRLASLLAVVTGPTAGSAFVGAVLHRFGQEATGGPRPGADQIG